VLSSFVSPPPALGQDEASLSLTEAVERGMSRYPSVGAARAGADAARAAVGQASSAWFPSLSLDASITRFSDAMIVYPLHEFDIEAVPPFNETLTRASTVLSYTLFDGFGRSAEVRRARADFGVAESDVAGTTQELIARIASTYLDVLGRREVLEANDQRIAALEAELARVEQLLAAGRTARLEVVRVEAELASARADRVAAAVALDVAERELGRLIGEPVEQTRSERLLPMSLPAEVPPFDLTDLVERANSNSPLVARAERQRQAASAAVSLARSSWWPRLDLMGTLVNYGSPNTDDQLEWNVALAARWSLFTGLNRSRGVERAQAQRRAADETLRLTEIEVAKAVDRAYSVVQESSARVSSLQAAVTSFEEVARIERLRLETGTGVQTDFLRAEAELLAARANLAETRHGEMKAHVELARVLGELNPTWLSENLEMNR
jgi:outer membrane protein TolC